MKRLRLISLLIITMLVAPAATLAMATDGTDENETLPVTYEEVTYEEVIGASGPVFSSSLPIPEAPSEVSISGIEPTRATVAWTPVAGAMQYSIWVDGQRWAGSLSPGTELKGLQPYTEYTVYVTAANAAGESSFSLAAQFTTLPQLPSCPGGLEIVETHGSGAVIQWQPLPAWQEIEQYRVYVDGLPVADIETQEGFQTAELTGLEPGKHSVSVSGINKNQEGPISPPAKFTVQEAATPLGFEISNAGWDRLMVTWDAGAENVESYDININGSHFAKITGDKHEYELGSLEAETVYTVTLRAAYTDGSRSEPARIEAETASKKEFNLENTIQAYDYIKAFTPGIIALFAIGGAFAVARAAKYAIERKKTF